LVSLGGSTYLEIIGPDPGQPAPDGPRPFGVDDLVEPALAAWCVRPLRPLDKIVAEATAVGVDFGPVTAMSRRRPDGVLLEWTLTLAQVDGPFGCALPFLIDWGSSAHPSETLPSSARLMAFEVEHPEAQLLNTVLDILGLADYRVSRGELPALRVTIAAPRGDVTLSS
jgi:hypothetical protein